MVTKELLKAAIDKVPEENLGVLYRIVQALEEPVPSGSGSRTEDAAEWKAWIADAYGSMADAPVERGEQGRFEIRESIE
jgi:hypothetical protein